MRASHGLRAVLRCRPDARGSGERCGGHCRAIVPSTPVEPTAAAARHGVAHAVLSQVCVLLGAGGANGDPGVCGSMTSGGTESILTAVKASRWAWQRWLPSFLRGPGQLWEPGGVGQGGQRHYLLKACCRACQGAC